jgi:hypothetical protein
MTEIVPAMFEHCARVYTAMEKDSKVEIDDNDTQMRVYEGHLTRVFAKLELSTPYYTTIMKHLKRMGCVEQIRRGGGSQTSKWRLIKEPDAQAFDAYAPPAGRAAEPHADAASGQDGTGNAGCIGGATVMFNMHEEELREYGTLEEKRRYIAMKRAEDPSWTNTIFLPGRAKQGLPYQENPITVAALMRNGRSGFTKSWGAAVPCKTRKRRRSH